MNRGQAAVGAPPSIATVNTKIRRTDIQGLRAVGALLVVTFHIWFGRVSGGVDVFFVISGFLLLGSLVREASTGKVNLSSLTIRLIKRLLPSSLLVLAVVLLTGPFWLSKSRWDPVSFQIIASAFYVENWILAFTSVDYLNREQVASPIQHYWAMSVQVQATAFYAMLIVTVTRITKSYRTITRNGLIWCLGVCCTVSFIYAVTRTSQNQPFTYFDTFARLWEFSLGGLVAVLLKKWIVPAGVRTTLGWIGVLLILSCGALLPVSTSFPGVAALWPTFGAALVLAFGAADDKRGVGRLLSIPPLLWIGNRSYALYLWHFPILIFYLTVTYRTSVDFLSGALIIATSLLAADLTHRLVERPFIGSRVSRIGAVAAPAALFVGGLAAVAFTWTIYTERARASERLTAQNPIVYAGAAAFDKSVPPAAIRPSPLLVATDWKPIKNGCLVPFGQSEVINCVFGNTNGEKTIAIVGGSHSVQWLPALIDLAKYNNWKLVTYTKAACQFATLDASQRPGEERSCKQWNNNALALLLREKPDYVFTTSTRTGVIVPTNDVLERPEIIPDNNPVGPEPEILQPGASTMWETLIAAGIPVIAVRDTPRLRINASNCVEINGRHDSRCTRARRMMLAERNPASLLRPRKGLWLLDLSNYFCSDRCPSVAGNVLMYRDTHHVSSAYARTLAPMLQKQLPVELQRR